MNTLPISEFLAFVTSNQVPPAPPAISRRYEHDTTLAMYRARDECTARGMWAIVDQQWTRQLASWLGSRQVLEIMSGRGWLARALADHAVSIIATDNGEWDDRHSKIQNLFPVQKLDALAAIRKYPLADILLVSWSPYGDETITRACELWHSQIPNRPIIYIGESSGGCNAPDSFFEHFTKIENHPNIIIPQWDGLHDNLQIGTWNP